MNRVIAWFAFLLGIVASTAANVAHARDELGPQLAASFAPLALMLTVEMAVRSWSREGWRWSFARWGGTGLVAVVTAIVSYRHQAALFSQYGEDAVNAAILPLSSDGLMIVAAAALLALSNPALSMDSAVDSPVVQSKPVHGQSTGWTVQPVPVQRPSVQSNGQRALSIQKSSPVQPGAILSAHLDKLRDAYPHEIPKYKDAKVCLDTRSSQTVSDVLKLLRAERGQSKSMDKGA